MLTAEIDIDGEHVGTLRVSEVAPIHLPELVYDNLFLYDVELELSDATVKKQITAYQQHGWRRLAYKAMAAVAGARV